ncbi:MAG: hypothetical protein QW622_00225 [Candidatus Pacearchaeota archaeon]
MHKRGKKAQLTLFVVIAIIVISLALIGYFVIKPRISKLPKDIMTVEESYLKCLESIAKRGIEIAEEKGGYIYEIPSESEGIYFSNNLEFMGEKIPYWFYYNANGQAKEQVPSINFIASEISRYVKENIDFCDKILENYEVEFEKKPYRIDITIGNKRVDGKAFIDLKMTKGNNTYLIREHIFSVPSEIKLLYDNARAIYDYEKSSLFLENYTFDIISLYAPTTGFELQCVPLVFDKEKIKQDIFSGLKVNLERIKFRGDYFSLASEENKYYVNDLKISNGLYVNIIAPLRPTKIEVYADEVGGLIKFDPVGNQLGISGIGFCYVPYHFVYDVKYPLLILVSNGNEVFKFPLTVVIERNGVKNLLEEKEVIGPRICNNAVTKSIINIFSEDGKSLDADVYFKCLDATCYLGQAKDGYLEANVPECVNGLIIARYTNYGESSLQLDTTSDFIASVYLKKLSNITLDLTLEPKENALVLFEGERSYVLNYPEQKEISLTEGKYKVTVYVFKEKSISLDGESEICYDVPVFFGLTRKQCTKLETLNFDKVVVGGGITEVNIDETMLARGKLNIYFERFGEPKDVDEIGKNYDLIETSELKIS